MRAEYIRFRIEFRIPIINDSLKEEFIPLFIRNCSIGYIKDVNEI